MSPQEPAAPAEKLAPDPIIPIDDADFPDDAPTRVLLPGEHLAVKMPEPVSAPPAAAHGALPPPPTPPATAHAPLPPPPTPPATAHAPLPPPPRAPTVELHPSLTQAPRARPRAPMPTEPAAWRLQESQPPASSLQSVPPMAVSEPPPPIELPMRRAPRWIAAIGGLAAAAALVLGLSRVTAAAFASHGGGALVATVAGAGGQPVKGLAVFVDGARRCESSPCRVEGLEAGAHFVKVTADGYVPTAAQAVAVQGGQDAVLRLDLVKESAQATTNPASAQHDATAGDEHRADDDGVVQPSSLPAAPDDAPARRAVAHYRSHATPTHRSAPPEPPSSDPSPPAVTGKGIILLSSTPPANVAVDGHALGATPKAVRVDAGKHVVLFAGEAGRAVRSVDVKPGARLNVAVKL